MSLVPVAPAFIDGSASDLFCLSCQEPGHACIASVPAAETPDGTHTRLRVQKRGGSVLAIVSHQSTTTFGEFATQYGAYCGGCGCAELAACPDGCWWSGAFRIVQLKYGHTVSLKLCTRCVSGHRKSP